MLLLMEHYQIVNLFHKNVKMYIYYVLNCKYDYNPTCIINCKCK